MKEKEKENAAIARWLNKKTDDVVKGPRCGSWVGVLVRPCSRKGGQEIKRRNFRSKCYIWTREDCIYPLFVFTKIGVDRNMKGNGLE